MNTLNKTKINHVMTHLPSSKVLTSAWLFTEGVTPQLNRWYVQSGWFKRIGQGAYSVVGQSVSYFDALCALQQQLKSPVHVGGKTALQLLNMSHFVPLGGLREILLFGEGVKELPRWLTTSKQWPVRFTLCRSKLFHETVDLSTLIQRDFESVPVQLSCPERAIMELLEHVPQKEALEEALLLMENLVFLRSTIVQSLLENCTSIKVKRLFLYLAKRCQHTWFNDLDLSSVELGKGKRVIGQGGHYNAEYKISLSHLSRDDDEQLPAV